MVVWGDEGGKAYFAKWGGEAFTEPKVINQPGTMAFATSWAGPDLAAHGDTVYVTWKQIPEENNHIYIKHSYDGGVHFSASAEVDMGNDYITRFPTVTADENGNPFVTYMKLEKDYVYPRYVVARSEDMGETFLRDTIASVLSGNNVCECSPASLVASGSAGVLLYRNNTDGQRNVWGGISINGCTSFNNSIQLDSVQYRPSTCPASGPHGVIVGDTLYAVYMSGPAENTLIYLNRLSLSKPTLITEPVTGSIPGIIGQNFPRVSGVGMAAAIVWTQTAGGNNQVCLSFTPDLTNGFPANYDTVADGVMINADVAIGGGFIYVVWEDQVTRSVMFRRGVYYKKNVVVENTSVLINPPVKGQKYFTVNMPGILSCTLTDASGSENEVDIAYTANAKLLKVLTGDLDPGKYTVKLWDEQGRSYTAQVELK